MAATILRRHWNDWQAFVTAADQGKSPMPLRDRHSHHEDAWRTEFTGTATWGEAISLARTGWPEIGRKIERFSSKLFDAISRYVVKPEPAYGYEGIALDIGRYCDGEPEHWMYWEPSEAEVVSGRGIVRILYNRIASCGVGSEVLVAKGSAIAALARLLDYAGVRAEITVGCWNGYSGDRFNLVDTVRVKEADQDLNMDLLGYSLAHTSAYRRLFFSVWEQNEKDVLRERHIWPNRGYGMPGDWPEAERPAACDVYLGSSTWGEPYWADESQATAWVLDTLKKQGITLTDEAAAS